MFTGIVEEIGTVESLAQAGGGYQLKVRAVKVVEDVGLGDSLAVNGACLTVTRFDPRGFSVGLSPETMRRTNLGDLRAGEEVNLERALRLTGRLGGHYVQGHVDGVATLSERRQEADALVLRFDLAEELTRYVVEKGFVALDGVSLTVTGCGEGWFSVALIPFTQKAVTLAAKGVAQKVNIEVDIIAKYVESLLGRQGTRRGVTAEFLAEHGFA